MKELYRPRRTMQRTKVTFHRCNSCRSLQVTATRTSRSGRTISAESQSRNKDKQNTIVVRRSGITPKTTWLLVEEAVNLLNSYPIRTTRTIKKLAAISNNWSGKVLKGTDKTTRVVQLSTSSNSWSSSHQRRYNTNKKSAKRSSCIGTLTKMLTIMKVNLPVLQHRRYTVDRIPARLTPSWITQAVGRDRNWSSLRQRQSQRRSHGGFNKCQSW